MVSLDALLWVLLLAAITYCGALYFNKMSLVDVVWTTGMGGGALLVFSQIETITLRSILVLVLVFLWSTRLSYHLIKNRVFKSAEDPRYVRLIEHSGRSWRLVFGVIFIAQAFLVWLFLHPIKASMTYNAIGFGIHDILAFVLGILALSAESLSDTQLNKFRALESNKGQVCKVGLWRYTRHPNYFFEWVFWWSFVVFALGSNLIYTALLGPIVMYLFLRYISGVPFAEMSSLESRGEAYRKYQNETSVFFPSIPKRSISDE